MNILVKDGEIVGVTELPSISGYGVYPAPEGWDGELSRLRYTGSEVVLIPEEEWRELRLAETRRQLIERLNAFTDEWFYHEASLRGGYRNMGEILYDAETGDEDATFLKALYDAVWSKEEDLEGQLGELTLEELQGLDLESWAREAFEQVKSELEASGA